MGLFRRHDFRVESFERVAVGDELVLLRLSGRWSGAAPRDARLVALTPAGREELPALPEPPGAPGEPGLWRGAFSAERRLVVAGVALQLEAPGRRPTPLPAPREHGARPPSREKARLPLPAARRAPLVEPVPRRPRPGAEEELRQAAAVEAELREQLRATVGDAADFMRRLEGYEQRRERLDAELGWERLLHKETRRTAAEAERERDEAHAALEAAREEMERLRRETEGRAVALDKAERRLARVTEEADRERRARMDAEAGAHARIQRLKVQHDRAREELARSRARETAGSPDLVAELERRLERREAGIALARERLESGSRDLARIERRLTELRERSRALSRAAPAAPTAAGPARVQSPPRSSARSPAQPDRRFVRDRERLDAIRTDAERGMAKLAALEHRIAELRDAIDPALAGSLPPPADAGARDEARPREPAT